MRMAEQHPEHVIFFRAPPDEQTNLYMAMAHPSSAVQKPAPAFYLANEIGGMRLAESSVSAKRWQETMHPAAHRTVASIVCSLADSSSAHQNSAMQDGTRARCLSYQLHAAKITATCFIQAEPPTAPSLG